MSGATRTPILTALLRAGRQRKRQRGQALIEFAMFFLILLYLLAGGTNITFLLNDHLNIVYAARQGARTGAVLGNQGGFSGYDPDCAIVGAVDAALAGLPNLTINKITIYLAGANGQAFSPALQDRYSGNATCVVTGGVPAIVPSTAILIQGWLPAARANQPFTEASLGVRIDYTYKFQFPIVPGYSSVSTFDYAVMPIDPVEIPTVIPCGHPHC
jgi:hypothetical protein